MWRWYFASRALCALLLVPESGVLSDITYIARVLSEAGPALALPEYPWPAVALLYLPLLLGVSSGLHYYLALVAIFLAADAAFTWFLWRTPGRRMTRGLVLWLLVGPLLGPLVLTRFDTLAGALAASALVCLASSRPASAGALNALGCAIKLWPAVGFPALLIPGGWRERLRAIGGGAVAGSALAAATVLAAGFERLWSPLAFQAQRGLQVEAFAALPLLWARHFDGAGTWSTRLAACRCYEVSGPGVELALQLAAAGLALGLAGVALLYVRAFVAPPAVRTAGLALRLTLLTVIVWIATNKVFSPQYLIWLAAPLAVLAVLPGEDLPLTDAALLLAACALTHLVFPWQHSSLLDPNPSKAWVLATLALRDLLLIALAARLAARSWRDTLKPDPA